MALEIQELSILLMFIYMFRLLEKPLSTLELECATRTVRTRRAEKSRRTTATRSYFLIRGVVLLLRHFRCWLNVQSFSQLDQWRIKLFLVVDIQQRGCHVATLLQRPGQILL